MVSAITFALALCPCQTLAFARARLTCALIASDEDDDDDDDDGMEWNGMEWNGMEWNGMEWNGMEWNDDGMEWNGMEWNEWNGMEWNGISRESHHDEANTARNYRPTLWHRPMSARGELKSHPLAHFSELLCTRLRCPLMKRHRACEKSTTLSNPRQQCTLTLCTAMNGFLLDDHSTMDAGTLFLQILRHILPRSTPTMLNQDEAFVRS